MLKQPSTRVMEDSSAESCVEYGGPDQEVSDVNNINNWDGDHSCDILSKIVADFCPPKSLFVIPFTRNGICPSGFSFALVQYSSLYPYSSLFG